MPTRSPWSAAPAVLALWAGLTLVAAEAHASGFAIFEQGARGMGFAGAYAAQTNDPSAIFHNPAGIAFLKGKHLYIGGTLIAPTSDFAGDSPFPGVGVTEEGDAGIIVPPALDYSHQLTERLVLGLGVHVPYGLRTRWKNRDTTFTGRFVSKEAKVNSYSINPTVAYQLADRLAVGGGLDVRLSNVSLQRNAGAVDPFTFAVKDVAAIDLESDTSTKLGFNVGIVAKPSANLSFGVSYRHKIASDFSGSANFALIPTGNPQFDGAVAAQLPAGAVPVTTRIEFPSIVEAGVAYTHGDWTLAADVDFQQWSSFDTLPLTFQGRPDLSTTVPENYENSRIYRIGLERRLNDSWSVRGGYYFDETPSPAASVSPLLPDADRHGAALGFSYNVSTWNVDVAYWHLFFKDRSTEGVNRDNYNGTYSNGANLLAVSLGKRF
jgi:long-chain fatty acid transport protein